LWALGPFYVDTVFCYILLTFGIFRGNLVYIFPALVFCTKKNLATLLLTDIFYGLLGRRIRMGTSPIKFFGQHNFAGDEMSIRYIHMYIHIIANLLAPNFWKKKNV
jgi:hypothetical protein